MAAIQQKLGLRVKELRKLKRQTQDSLAELLEIDVRSLRKLEAGESFPSVRTLENLVRHLDVSVIDLFNFEHLQPPEDLKSEVFNMVNANPDKITEIYKVVKALTS